MAKTRRMFFGGNTANGFYSLHSNIIGDNRKRLYILKGMPGGGKSSLMKKIAESLLQEGFTVEFHHCPSDPESIDSILIDELKIAIVDGTAPHIMDPVYPGLKDSIIDLAQYIDMKKLIKQEEEIIEATLKNKRAYFNAFSYLKASRYIFEMISEKNKLSVDFQKINKITISLINNIFSKRAIANVESLFDDRHSFSTANTPFGIVDYTDSLLEGIEDIYYVKGEIGTGKSTLINRIYDECRIRGYSTEIYHDSTFPEKIETLIIKDLNICITSNINGAKYTHTNIDLNEYFDGNIKDDKNYELYEFLKDEATSCLSEAREFHEIKEKLYIPTIGYDKIDEIRDNLLEEIMDFAK